MDHFEPQAEATGPRCILRPGGGHISAAKSSDGQLRISQLSPNYTISIHFPFIYFLVALRLDTFSICLPICCLSEVSTDNGAEVAVACEQFCSAVVSPRYVSLQMRLTPSCYVRLFPMMDSHDLGT